MDAWRVRFSVRKQQFIEKSSARMDVIEGFLQKLKDCPGDRETLDQITRCFHQMVGGAGLYELQDISLMCMTAEELCKSWQRRESVPGPDELHVLESTVGALRADVELLREGDVEETSGTKPG